MEKIETKAGDGMPEKEMMQKNVEEFAFIGYGSYRIRQYQRINRMKYDQKTTAYRHNGREIK